MLPAHATYSISYRLRSANIRFRLVDQGSGQDPDRFLPWPIPIMHKNSDWLEGHWTARVGDASHVLMLHATHGYFRSMDKIFYPWMWPIHEYHATPIYPGSTSLSPCIMSARRTFNEQNTVCDLRTTVKNTYTRIPRLVRSLHLPADCALSSRTLGTHAHSEAELACDASLSEGCPPRLT